jgi:hypothetical protein
MQKNRPRQTMVLFDKAVEGIDHGILGRYADMIGAARDRRGIEPDAARRIEHVKEGISPEASNADVRTF